MPSPFSEKNALYLLTILEALEKIKIYARDYQDPGLNFPKAGSLRRNTGIDLFLSHFDRLNVTKRNIHLSCDKFGMINECQPELSLP